jgi:hypothetical protein
MGSQALKFDMWLSYPGGPGGNNSTGSTQFATMGLNHLANRVNWADASALSSDGVWFGLDGEGGTTSDYRAYMGQPNGPSIDLTPLGASGLSASNHTAGIFRALFPGDRFETAGAPGKTWVEVEVRQENDMVSWWLDRTLVAVHTNSGVFRAGNIMLGLMDTFSSIANPVEDAFVLFDNVRVEELDRTFRILSASVGQGQRCELMFSAIPGQTYAVEMSDDLGAWTELLRVTASNAPVRVADGANTNSRRFYRVRRTN